MRRILRTAAVGAALLAFAVAPAYMASAETHPIDAQKSVLTVRVYKSGLFSVFAHNHEIKAPIQRGEVDNSDRPSVELWVNAASLQVMDPQVSAKDRGEIQKTMQGREVLDVGLYPAIHFRSSSAQKTGASHWMVRGELELHGQTHPVEVEVEEKGLGYQGSVTLSQRAFGITPIRIAGGTVNVKDEVTIEFDIATAR